MRPLLFGSSSAISRIVQVLVPVLALYGYAVWPRMIECSEQRSCDELDVLTRL